MIRYNFSVMGTRFVAYYNQQFEDINCRGNFEDVINEVKSMAIFLLTRMNKKGKFYEKITGESICTVIMWKH